MLNEAPVSLLTKLSKGLPWYFYKYNRTNCVGPAKAKTIFFAIILRIIIFTSHHESAAVHLLKTYCLPHYMLGLYCSEIRKVTSSDKHTLDVAWNNRKILLA